ncbi:sigma factor [Cupriavidus sp. D384]|uniref:sigma factor n=1 Tax=Cupriavidus sp. D384 TaxID=1538095 RepID=UPI0008299D7E
MRTRGSLFPSTIESLYCDHHSWLKGWLHRRLGSAEQAADLAQDTFVRLLNSECWARHAPDRSRSTT